MGCCSADEVIEDPLSSEVIKYIRDNLEANLVKQSTLNAELNNIYDKIKNNKSITPEEAIKEYSNLLINLTNTTTEQESNDIKKLLESVMNLVNNNMSSFHITIFEKLQGLKDYSNIKEIIEKNHNLKDYIKNNKELLNEVFNDLKQQGIVDISQITFEQFKEVCTKHGVKLSEEDLKTYYMLLKTKPKEGIDISADIKNYLDSNTNLKDSIEKNKNAFLRMLNKINREGIDITNMNFEEFKKLCKECKVKLSEEEMEKIFELMKENLVGFINYINNTMLWNNQNNDDNLIRRQNKIFILCQIELHTLPVAQKLENNY